MSTDDLWFESRGSGEPILLLHSALTDSRSWQPLVQRMGAGYQLVRFDSRGFGKSPAAEAGYDQLADLLTVMARAGLSSAHLVGNSMGADVAMAAAIFQRDVVRSLTLIGPGMTLETTPKESVRLMTQWRSARADGDTAAALEAARVLWLGSEEQAQRTLETIADPRSYQAVKLGTVPDFEISDIARISLPVLILVGAADDAAILESVRLLASTIRGSRMAEIPDARHHPQEDQPDRVAQLLSGFVAEAARIK